VPTKLEMSSQIKLSCDVPENVEIYRDVPTSQFYELMSRASIVVVALLKPEIASGQRVLKEAQLLHKAVVVTDTAGIDDYVSDGYDGLLVKPHDPADLREKLALLVSTPDLRQRLAEAGYITASKSANGDYFAEELAQVIGNRVLADPGKPTLNEATFLAPSIPLPSSPTAPAGVSDRPATPGVRGVE
jgi:glycosyltransferase involved in cell wall biosynthesis